MNYYSEKDIQDIVGRVLTQAGLGDNVFSHDVAGQGTEIAVEVSARHVHLSQAHLNALFGEGYQLTRKRDLSQPGQFLAEERVKLITRKGQIDNVGILGPVRLATQVELSLTDARILGVKVPVCLSGDLGDAADVVIIGPKGVVSASKSTIVAKAHAHMTPEDAKRYGVADGECVSIHLPGQRAITLNDVVVRVNTSASLAVHIDYDEANAAHINGNITGLLQKNR